MDTEINLGMILIISIISIIIIYFTINFAVKAALKQNDYYNRARTRLLIKKLLKDGYTKEEIVSAIDAEEIDFWNAINGVIEDNSYLDEIKNTKG